MDSPCKLCQDRHPHCHGACEKYAAFRAACDAANARRRAEIESLEAVLISKSRLTKINHLKGRK